jgi:hypothetical protein
LWPDKSTESDYEIVKVSPPENEPVHTCIDVFNGAELRITQQAILAEFEGNVAEKVELIAASFLATNVVQIDENKIYHGFSDKQGEVQSFIASPVKLPDDVWAGYILSLTKQ